jgi:hypothetical protein
MSRKHLVSAFLLLSVSFLAVSFVTRAADQAKVADVLILKGSPLGGVKFAHKEHSDKTGGKCETCHHASKPEKPSTAPQQACRDCHTKPVQAGMKTGTQAAFHNPTAKAGTCIDCHVKMNAEGKTAPTTCVKCHMKSNV